MLKRTSARLIEKGAKKPRLEKKSIFENFQHPDELSLFEKLTGCDHVLENIIGYLPNDDILSLTMTSKTLNLFISENPKVLQKFTMTIPQVGKHNIERYELKDIRHYPKWKLDYGILSENLSCVIEFLTPYGPHVKSLKIRAGQRRKDPKINVIKYKSKTSLLAILSCFQNLQELDIEKNDFFQQRWSFNENEIKNFPNLKKLRFTGKLNILQSLFVNCQLKSLDLESSWETDQEDGKIIHDFLKVQNELEDLRLRFCRIQLFADDKMTTMNFKLKSLALEFLEEQLAENVENVSKFLNLHKKSLVELTLDNCNVMGLIEGFNNVKTLILQRFSTRNLSAVWPAVQKLTMTGYGPFRHPRKTLEVFEQFFPSLKEIKIKYKDIRHDFFAVLPNVEKLEIEICNLISNLKVLRMNHVNISGDVNLIWNSNQLKELVVKDGYNNTGFIERLLRRDDTNLDLLMLVGYKDMEAANPALLQVINQNRNKIKILKIVEESD